MARREEYSSKAHFKDRTSHQTTNQSINCIHPHESTISDPQHNVNHFRGTLAQSGSSRGYNVATGVENSSRRGHQSASCNDDTDNHSQLSQHSCSPSNSLNLSAPGTSEPEESEDSASIDESVIAVQDDSFEPKPQDVLIGKGHAFRTRPGNQILHKNVECLKSDYLRSNRNGKNRIIRTLIELIHNFGGRFLMRDDLQVYWRVVADSVASKKIGHLLRERPKKTFQEIRAARIKALTEAKKIPPVADGAVRTNHQGIPMIRGAEPNSFGATSGNTGLPSRQASYPSTSSGIAQRPCQSNDRVDNNADELVGASSASSDDMASRNHHLRMINYHLQQLSHLSRQMSPETPLPLISISNKESSSHPSGPAQDRSRDDPPGRRTG